ncbi:hypothetical protein HPP92_026059 [Vanilla planifolia]|uniref:EF-hand domain-containing protein n=1 Tax=Vanilla planifolia TaxID=51239 RepID=A0A835PH23_VANPL|nr:hypothetical protein HPP92_026059 [Vanilla planifolia]
MRHIHDLPRYRQLTLSLEVMKIYAPLAHAVGADTISLELEDIALQYLLPNSYQYVDAWLKGLQGRSHSVIDACRDQLLKRLKHDSELEELVDDIKIEGRYKSRYSTMKKLLKDGRSPEEMNDLLGLRVILNPKPGDALVDQGLRAVYRTSEVIRMIWKEVPNKSKDYVSKPKENGYRSLHVVVDVCGHEKAEGPLMEIQIRTKEMDMVANAGTASHSLYKGGLTDPKEAKQLKAIMLAAADLAAFRLRDPPLPNYRDIDINRKDRAFQLLDKNGDGQITIEELSEVMEELGADGKDAEELMQILDANSDGSLSSDEFDSFQKQIELMRNFEDKDDHCKAMFGGKLQMTDTGLIQVYRTELGDKLLVNNRVHRENDKIHSFRASNHSSLFLAAIPLDSSVSFLHPCSSQEALIDSVKLVFERRSRFGVESEVDYKVKLWYFGLGLL